MQTNEKTVYSGIVVGSSYCSAISDDTAVIYACIYTNCLTSRKRDYVRASAANRIARGVAPTWTGDLQNVSKRTRDFGPRGPVSVFRRSPESPRNRNYAKNRVTHAIVLQEFASPFSAFAVQHFSRENKKFMKWAEFKQFTRTAVISRNLCPIDLFASSLSDLT